MKFHSQSDCDVLVVSPSYDSYRVVNATLRSMGLSVIWSTDPVAAMFLAKTTEVRLVICDARQMSDGIEAMIEEMRRNMPAVRQLTLTLPKRSANPSDLDSNIYAYKRLLHGVASYLALQMPVPSAA